MYKLKYQQSIGPLGLATVLCLTALNAACNLGLDEQMFNEPTHAIFGPNKTIYVSDGYSNARIAVFDHQGRFIRQWGSKGMAPGQLNTPHSLAITGDGDIIIADRDNSRIQQFTLQGELISQWIEPEQGRPWAVTVDPNDQHIILADGGDQDPEKPRAGLVRLNPKGEFLCRWSQYGAAPGHLDAPHMLATEDGDVFVVDLNNKRVQKFVQRAPCDYVFDASWPAATLGADFAPLGIAAHQGKIYISEQTPGAPLLVLDAREGRVLQTIAPSRFERPHGLDVSDEGILVADRDLDAVFLLSLDGQLKLNIASE